MWFPNQIAYSEVLKMEIEKNKKDSLENKVEINDFSKMDSTTKSIIEHQQASSGATVSQNCQKKCNLGSHSNSLIKG